MKTLAVVLVLVSLLSARIEPAGAGQGGSLQVDATASCTADGERSISWQATLTGLDSIEQTISLSFNFGGEQFGVLNPDTSNYLIFDPQFFTESYPGGADVLHSTATTGGDGEITGLVRVDAYVATFEVSDPQSTGEYQATTEVDLVDPCPQPAASSIVETTVAAEPAVRPSFTG